MLQTFRQADLNAALELLGRTRPGPLTCRECDVMGWLAWGKTDRDIAAILGISHRTVHKHLQRIYEKLGVETRTAAVARWLRGDLPAQSSRTSRLPG